MLRYRWLFIGGLVLAAILSLSTWGIRQGLDLKGGIHLVVRVHTDEAIENEIDNAVNRVRLDFVERKITFAAVDKVFDGATGEYGVDITGISPEMAERARKRAEALLGEFTREERSDSIRARLGSQPVGAIRSTTVDQAVTTIRGRVDATGVAEPVIQREGVGDSDRILVQLPGMQDAEAVKELIGRVAFLELKMVNSPAANAAPFRERAEALAQFGGTLPPNLELVEGVSEAGDVEYYAVDRVAVITGRDLADANPIRDDFSRWAVSFTLNAEGAKKFGQATAANVGRRLAVILDDQVKTAPRIDSKISDSGRITGAFTAEEAKNLALVLRAGALPAKIEYLEQRAVDPYLGRDSIRKGKFTSLVGFGLVVVVMLVYYRRSGLNAVAALGLNALLLLGALSFLGATLTLPGIAGFILTLGMAVDANVLVFEAIRENLLGGQPIKRAIEEGFSRALTTIVDSNLTTLLAAGALWMLGSGPVRGFGVTLFIGLLVNIFTAYFVSKTIFESTILRRDLAAGETLSI